MNERSVALVAIRKAQMQLAAEFEAVATFYGLPAIPIGAEYWKVRGALGTGVGRAMAAKMYDEIMKEVVAEIGDNWTWDDLKEKVEYSGTHGNLGRNVRYEKLDLEVFGFYSKMKTTFALPEEDATVALPEEEDVYEQAWIEGIIAAAKLIGPSRLNGWSAKEMGVTFEERILFLQAISNPDWSSIFHEDCVGDAVSQRHEKLARGIIARTPQDRFPAWYRRREKTEASDLFDVTQKMWDPAVIASTIALRELGEDTA